MAHHVDAARTHPARTHPVFTYERTPRGKLAARNAAHARALEAGADVVVAGDADAPPLDAAYLEELLAPFANSDDDVVATNARPTSPWTPIGAATNLVGWAQDALQPHVNGQGHALARAGWRAAGPFDVDVERELDSRRIRSEEEFAFRRRLEAAGDVVDVHDARVLNDTRRTRCKCFRGFEAVGHSPGPYCRRIGVDAMAPARRDDVDERDRHRDL